MTQDADVERRPLEADKTIRAHVLLALGAGLIPSPVFDVVVITAIEIKLIGALARIYDHPVPRKLVVYKVLISMLGGVGSVYLAGKLYPMLKSVALLGHAALLGALAVTSGASVYAVGKLFQTHFESGGTFLSSESPVLREHFTKWYEEGKRVVPGFLRPGTVLARTLPA